MIILILLMSCSSLSERKYQINTIETSADKLLSFADNLRINRQYEKSLNYYDKAAELYLLKNDKRKYLTSLSRIALVHLKMKKVDSFDKVLKNIINFNTIEKINFTRQVDYLRAKRFEYNKNTKEAISIYHSISKSLENIEQKSYYDFQIFILKETLSANEVEKSKDTMNELDELYQEGELEYIELYSACKFIYAEMAIKRNDKAAVKAIQECETLYNRLEYTAKLIDVYELFVAFYTKKNDQVKVAYYQKKIETHKKLNSIYIN